MEPEKGYPVIAISHSPNGDRFVVATGSTQCIVYDRECVQIIKFAKGDMYIHDLVHTKGHTMELSGVQWHPIDKNLILTSSADGSIRIWDLLGEAHFGNIMSKHVLKLRPAKGQGRLAATSCCYSPNGKRIVGGAIDGSIHIWIDKKTFSRCDYILRPGHSIDNPITCVNVSNNNNILISRSATNTDQKILVWDLAKLSSSSINKPVLEMLNLPNEYPTSNVDFSPDNNFICCAVTQKDSSNPPTATANTPITSSTNTNNISNNSTAITLNSANSTTTTNTNSFLYFFNIQNGLLMSKQQKVLTTITIEPCLKISVSKTSSAIMVKWQNKTNQIFCRYL